VDRETAGDILRTGPDRDEVPGPQFNQAAAVAQTVEQLFQLAPVLAR
jgi:hypothetical protein